MKMKKRLGNCKRAAQLDDHQVNIQRSECSTLWLNKFWLVNSSLQFIFIYRSQAILAKEQSIKLYIFWGRSCCRFGTTLLLFVVTFKLI